VKALLKKLRSKRFMRKLTSTDEGRALLRSTLAQSEALSAAMEAQRETGIETPVDAAHAASLAQAHEEQRVMREWLSRFEA
jgi:hypothetical protein